MAMKSDLQPRAATQDEQQDNAFERLMEENNTLRNQLREQVAEIGRLRHVELDATRFTRMQSTPNGIDLYIGAHYQAVDRDGDGVVDDLELIHERPDTFGLSQAEIRRSQKAREELDRNPPSGPSDRDALTFRAAEAETLAAAGAKAVLAEAAAAEAARQGVEVSEE